MINQLAAMESSVISLGIACLCLPRNQSMIFAMSCISLLGSVDWCSRRSSGIFPMRGEPRHKPMLRSIIIGFQLLYEIPFVEMCKPEIPLSFEPLVRTVNRELSMEGWYVPDPLHTQLQ